jgi:hypothetical protein
VATLPPRTAPEAEAAAVDAPVALAEPLLDPLERSEPDAEELFTEEAVAEDLATVEPLETDFDPELDAVEYEDDEPAGFRVEEPEADEQVDAEFEDEDVDVEYDEEEDEFDEAEVEAEVSVLEAPILVEPLVEEEDLEEFEDFDEATEAERIFAVPLDDAPEEQAAERTDVDSEPFETARTSPTQEPAEGSRDDAATAVLAGRLRHDGLVTDPDSGLMTYHSANAKRGIGLVTGALAGLGGLFVAIMAIQGNLVTPPGIISAVIGLVALLVFLRLGAMSNSVTLSDGMLEVVFGDNHHKFDLTSDKTVVEMHGTPGDRDWRMMLVRRGLSPVEIDAHAVDPEPFTEAMRQWRPNL